MVLLTAVFVTAIFIFDGHYGFSISDEGFLWYGAQRVMAGEVPLRDFMSYDIGRYYWSAFLMGLMGNNGIVTMRIAASIFLFIAVALAMSLMVQKFIRNGTIYCVLILAALIPWMAHPHKFFDVSIPLLFVSVLSFLLAAPTKRNYFLFGLLVGVAAVFGRNHGLYGVVAFLLFAFYSLARRENALDSGKQVALWSLGVFVGYLPVIAYIAFVPGFADAFWYSIRLVFEIKSTNVMLPVPWPWQINYSLLSFFEALRQLMIGSLFIIIILYGFLGIAWIFRQALLKKQVHPVFIASVFVGIPYMHYAFSRADLTHLTNAVVPILLGLLVLLDSWSMIKKWVFASVLLLLSLLVALPTHTGWCRFSPDQCIYTDVGSDRLYVQKRTAEILNVLKFLSLRFVPNERTLLAEPFCPGAYAVLGKKAPMWDIYALFPRSVDFQLKEVARIKASNPSLAIIDYSALDGRNELQFSNTHPIVDQYIRDNFVRVNDIRQNPAFYLSRDILL